MTDKSIQVGDVVCIADPTNFVSNFAKKIEGRDAIVLNVGPTAFGMFKGMVNVEFQKRNGRGKTFTHWLRINDFRKKGQE